MISRTCSEYENISSRNLCSGENICMKPEGTPEPQSANRLACSTGQSSVQGIKKCTPVKHLGLDVAREPRPDRYAIRYKYRLFAVLVATGYMHVGYFFCSSGTPAERHSIPVTTHPWADVTDMYRVQNYNTVTGYPITGEPDTR